MFQCTDCNKIFTTKFNLQKHIKNKSCKNATIECDFCDNKFTTIASMKRHIKKSCKNKACYITIAEKQQIYEQLLKLQKENEELKDKFKKIEKVPKITNNTTNNNANTMNINNGVINNFTLYAHGKEDLDRIDKNDLLLGIKNGFNSTTKLTELINFNPKYPEYHNVYISNMKSKYAMKYDGNVWTLVRKNDLIDDVYEQKRDYIYINMDNYSKSLSKVQRESIDRWMLLDEINPNDPIIKRIKSDIELLLYNNRGIPIATTEKEKLNLPINDQFEQILEESKKDTVELDDKLLIKHITPKSKKKKKSNVTKMKKHSTTDSDRDKYSDTYSDTFSDTHSDTYSDELISICEKKKTIKKIIRPRTKAKNSKSSKRKSKKTTKVSKRIK
jgi:hypothetical protein